MSYIIKGSLKGAFCNDCIHPVVNTSIKVYKPVSNDTTTALVAASVKETFHQVSDEELKSKQKLLLGEGSLNQDGEFEVTINEKGYDGGAVDIDWYCGNGPIPIEPRPKKEQNLQFHITTIQPMWRTSNDQNSIAPFSYVIPSKWFCQILRLFDMWIVCGTITDCETGKPVSGVNVFVYDVDWLQDDFLGNAYTDANGKFLIVYPGDNFKQTILSPWLNVEWPAGPDYYFKIESSSGAVLLQEDRQTGHNSGRENAPNCFCIDLCIKGGIGAEYPWFTSAGNFSITSDIDSTGKTIHSVSSAGGTGFGFFGSVKLGGYATKRVPTAPGSVLWYRFQYSLDSTNWSPLTAAQMESTQLLMGKKQMTWNGGPAFQNVVVDINQPASVPDAVAPDNFPNPIPDQVIHPDANGWIRVDQTILDNGFVGSLFWVNTNTIAGGGNASGGISAGTAPTAAQQKNGTIVYFRFQTTDDPANAASPNLKTQTTPIAKLLVNNWDEVNLLKLEELFAGGGTGCTPITTHAHVDYTVDHELIATWSLTASSNAIPAPPGISGLPSGNVIRGEAAIIDLATWAPLSPAFSTWPSCAYSLVLNTRRKLTTGEWNDPTRHNQVIFCK